MKSKSLLLLAVAVGCGVVAMVGVHQAMSGDKNAESNLIKVYVAGQEIPAGRPLDASMLKTQAFPKENVPPGAVVDPKQFEERSLTVKAFPGDLILTAKLGEKGKGGISSLIPKGMRLFSVPVNMTLTHSGLMQAGDRVDVFVTYPYNDPTRGQIKRTKLILENIQVFATDKTTDAESPGTPEKETKSSRGSSNNGIKNVSLLVTPDQGALLTYAKRKGDLELALRNSDDTELVETKMIDDVIFQDAEPIATLPEEKTEEKGQGAGDLQGFLTELNQHSETEATAKNEQPHEEVSTEATEEETAEEEAPTEVAEKPKNIWKITIYEKEGKRVEEIVLPDEKTEEGEEAATEETASEESAVEETGHDAKSEPAQPKRMFDYLKGWMTGRKSSAPVETTVNH